MTYRYGGRKWQRTVSPRQEVDEDPAKTLGQVLKAPMVVGVGRARRTRRELINKEGKRVGALRGDRLTSYKFLSWGRNWVFMSLVQWLVEEYCVFLGRCLENPGYREEV